MHGQRCTRLGARTGGTSEDLLFGIVDMSTQPDLTYDASTDRGGVDPFRDIVHELGMKVIGRQPVDAIRVKSFGVYSSPVDAL